MKVTVALLLALPLLAVASPAPAPFTKVPFARSAHRTFKRDDGTVDVPALVAHTQDVSAYVFFVMIVRDMAERATVRLPVPLPTSKPTRA